MSLLKSLARPGTRGGRDCLLVAEDALWSWGKEQGLSPRQAMEAALEAGIFPAGYERNFPALTVSQQLRLFRSAVLVAGLGGLGGCQAQLLARVGVGRLLLADGDVFAPSNLNRQLLAFPHTLGQSKAQVTASYLQALNPALLLEPIPQYLTPENLRGYLPQVQAVLDALDAVAPRQHLLAAARECGLPLVHGAVHEYFGQVTTILPGDALDFSHLYPAGCELHPGDPPGVLAPTVTLVASLQVQETLRLLLGQPPAYHGRLAHWDGDTGRLELWPLG